MSVRSIGRDSEVLDRIFCYFMRTALCIERSGVCELPLAHTLPAPYGAFTDAAMDIIAQAAPPELAQLLLDAAHDAVLQAGGLTDEELLGLRLIKALAWHSYYDAEDSRYDYLLALQNLWGDAAGEYAMRTFYPNLPAAVRTKYGIDQMLAHLPPDFFRPDDI